MSKIKKTNVMRILDSHKYKYDIYLRNLNDESEDSATAAMRHGKNPDLIHKTLVAQGNSKAFYVFIVPLNGELDLKKAAKACGEKKLEMIPHKNLLAVTGYMKGGCSPVGMKKPFPTYLHISASENQMIIVSGGKVGLSMELKVDDLLTVTKGHLV
ncbi:MAG: Cys-tRNA(Pro) deacylase, partial [Carboxylicivirga sp.]|nr:Cys-tRNA(Pro) deacylase [Carboxylicivirga sp.]